MKFEQFDYIAFVDIDGVFNHLNMKCDEIFLEEAVEVINELYEKYDIKLVLSSSWRHSFTFSYMEELFRKNNVKAPLIDRTYICASANKTDLNLDDIDTVYDVNIKTDIFSRETEIYAWVNAFKPKHFVIFDDYKMMNDFLYEKQVLTRFFGEDSEKLGLRKFYMNQIDNILRKDVKYD